MKKLNRNLVACLVAILALTTAAWISATTAATSQSGSKYGHYIVKGPKASVATPDNLDAQPKDMLINMTYLDNEIVKGAYYTECSWLMKAYPERVWVKEHAHDFDEVFGFYGSDPKNPKSLGGEVELWIGGERHLLTESCLVFVPKGMKHCPLSIKRVDKPIFMFTSGPSRMYGN
jgi:hypothetical protein